MAGQQVSQITGWAGNEGSSKLFRARDNLTRLLTDGDGRELKLDGGASQDEGLSDRGSHDHQRTKQAQQILGVQVGEDLAHPN